MEYNSQLILSNSQEALLADGLDDGFLAAEWFNDFSGNESETDDEAVSQEHLLRIAEDQLAVVFHALLNCANVR